MQPEMVYLLLQVQVCYHRGLTMEKERKCELGLNAGQKELFSEPLGDIGELTIGELLESLEKIHCNLELLISEVRMQMQGKLKKGGKGDGNESEG